VFIRVHLRQKIACFTITRPPRRFFREPYAGGV
jgi:hypothetical protein